jgi:ribosomal protein S12 methylthiotransferase
MRRGKGQERLAELLFSLRQGVRGLVLRSTVMVGFPGEDEDDFRALSAFALRIRFERLGVFRYSDEEGTAAVGLDDKVRRRVSRARYEKLMRLQRRIHRAHLHALTGTVHEAIVEEIDGDDDTRAVGRLWSQAPEIDGTVRLVAARPLAQGQIVAARIDEARDYDVTAQVLAPEDPLARTAWPFALRRVAPRRTRPLVVVGEARSVSRAG